MHIALVTPRYRPQLGGVETHVERIAAGLAANGHEVEVLTQAPRRAELPPAERIDGVLVRRFPTLVDSRHFAFAPRLGPFLARHSRRYDLVHAHNYHALPALVATATARPPLVLTPHYHGVSESPGRNLLHRPYRVAGARMIGRATAIVSVSSSEAGLLADHFPQARAKIAVIPNGVDTAAIDAAEPFPPNGRTTVLSAGRLESYKQVDLVVRALEHLDPSYVLRVAGDGPARDRLRTLVGELGLEERVTLLGQVDREVLDRWFRSADVYVSMSKIEAMGIASLEAAYAGAAVVASDIPAHRDSATLVGGGFEFLAPDASAAQLAAVIAAAARSGRSGGSGVPSWDRVLERTEAVYDAAAGRA